MIRVAVSPKLLNWALNRARLNVEGLSTDFPKIQEWLRGEAQPTMKQLERFAKKTHAAIGYFFLPEPPVEILPIHDFRRMADAHPRQPSPNLLDTLYLCQQRQEWYRDYLLLHHQAPLEFVGAAQLAEDVVEVAATMRQALGFNLEEHKQYQTWTEALRRFIDQAGGLGALVMVSGVVGNSNSRKLDPEEFRGFALADELAPLIFINGSDNKAAQMFTLAHELAHIWLGASGVSNAQAKLLPDERTERWCNKVAAELLVPLEKIRASYRADTSLQDEMKRLAREFKVSTLVVLRRLYDAGEIDKETLWETYDKELKKLTSHSQDNPNSTLGMRVGKRFARALISSTLEGQTLFRDAFQMLGIRKTETFYHEAKNLGLR